MRMDTKELYLEIPQGQIYVKRWIVDQKNNFKNAPIILFHESLGSVELWRDFPEQLALATQRDVIAYDRIGFGKSSVQVHSLELNFIEQEVQDTFSFLFDALGIKKFVAMGHSVGGGMAAVCAAWYPFNCVALITESAQAMVEDVTLEGIRKAKVNFKNEKFFNRLAKYHADKTQWVLDAWTETWLNPAFAAWCLDRYLAQVCCPVLSIHGEQDEYATLAQPQRFVELVQGPAELCIIPECQHFPHQEKPEQVLQVIKQFLANIKN